MATHLIISLHEDKNPLRAKELETCLERNLRAGYTTLTVLYEEKDKAYVDRVCEGLIRGNNDVYFRQVPCSRRPCLSDYIVEINEGARANPDLITVFSNSDIYIEPEDLDKIKNYDWTPNLFMALSRWDVLAEDGSLRLLDRGDSQDVYVLRGACRIQKEACPLGYPGSDGRICWEAKNAGYTVINPSKSIVFKHLHHVKVFNYREGGKPDGAVLGDQICPEPYHFVAPHV